MNVELSNCINLPTHLPTYLSTYPPTHLPTHLLTYSPTYPPTDLPTYPRERTKRQKFLFERRKFKKRSHVISIIRRYMLLVVVL